jgi:hypothetical protein
MTDLERFEKFVQMLRENVALVQNNELFLKRLEVFEPRIVAVLEATKTAASALTKTQSDAAESAAEEERLRNERAAAAAVVEQNFKAQLAQFEKELERAQSAVLALQIEMQPLNEHIFDVIVAEAAKRKQEVAAL